MKISVSLLATYLYCSRKLFLEQILSLKEPPKESLVIGNIRHEIYDKINKYEQEIVTSITEKATFDNIQILYKQKYLEISRKAVVKNQKRLEQVGISSIKAFTENVPFIIEESSMRATNIFNFMKVNHVFGEELWNKLTPKIISELKLESVDLKLTGIIDQVHIYDNAYVPYELKTGRAPQEGIWPPHRIQIAAYSLLLEERFNKPISEGFVFYLDSKEKRHVAMNPFMKEEVKQVVNEVITLLESKELPDFCNNENKCKKCGLRQTCYNQEEVNNLIKIKILENNQQKPYKY